MKISDAQPAILQQPNVERGAQAAATGAQIAQQAFAQQMQRQAALRPEQVQAAQPGAEPHPADIRPDERGDRARRRPVARPDRRKARDGAGEDVPPPAESRLDVRI